MFLYGDSSPSPLKVNAIELLQAVLAFSVRALQSQQSISEQRERAEAFRQAAAVDLGRLETLEKLVERALAGAANGSADSPASRCAAAIMRSGSDLVQSERSSVRDRLGSELSQVEGETTRQQAAMTRALGTLLEHHDLPDASNTLRFRANASGRYDAHLKGDTPYGVVTVVALEAASTHALAQVVKIERVIERVEIQAPEESGWLQKTRKMRLHRLDKQYLTHLVINDAETAMSLRIATDGSGEGFDIVVRHSGEVTLQRIAENGELRDDPMTPSDTESVVLKDLGTRLSDMARELASTKRVMREARMDGEDLERTSDPQSLVQRLVTALAPAIVEISKRSLSPGELVLKRLVGGDRREEYFASKAELLQRIEKTPEPLRFVFAPLGLDPNAATVRSIPPALPPAGDDGPALELDDDGSEVDDEPEIAIPIQRGPHRSMPPEKSIELSADALELVPPAKPLGPPRPATPSNAPVRKSTGLVVVADEPEPTTGSVRPASR